MLCIENNQLIEDAATGSASSCLQAFLKYHTPVIEIINNQENLLIAFTNFFQWKIIDGHFDIKLVENTTHRKRGGETE
jgi:trans-2,3-dihydro-3-hydroxyanthranilate isomerase